MRTAALGVVIAVGGLPSAALSDPVYCRAEATSAFSKFDYLTYALQYKVACGLDFDQEAAWFAEHAVSMGCSPSSDGYQMLQALVAFVVDETPGTWNAWNAPSSVKDKVCSLAENYSPQTNSTGRDAATKARDRETWSAILKIANRHQHFN